MKYKIQANLNLAEGFRQCGKSLAFKVSRFPAGEQYFNCNLPWDVTTVRINTRIADAGDIMTLLLAVDSLRRQGATQIEVFMPYLPYSRQDRQCELGDSFSLSVMCALLRTLQVRLITYDVHSNVAEVLLDGCETKFVSNEIEVRGFADYIGRLRNCRSMIKPLALICPDDGGRKKAEALATSIQCFDSVVYCHKKRSGVGLLVDPIDYDLRGMNCLVVDDICDGGATFLALGERLFQAGCEDAYLFVSHGVFSKGVNDLNKYYKKIGTTNSIRGSENSLAGVKSFKLDY